MIRFVRTQRPGRRQPEPGANWEQVFCGPAYLGDVLFFANPAHGCRLFYRADLGGDEGIGALVLDFDDRDALVAALTGATS